MSFTARTALPQRPGSLIMADPAPLRTTFFTGQPMLMSTKRSSGCRYSATSAAAARFSGSDPKSCTPVGASPARMNLMHVWGLWARPGADVISVMDAATPNLSMNLR